MAQQGQMIQQLTAAVHQMSAKLEQQQILSASKERIALINAKAGILEAALKAKSAEALAVFNADIAHIDRQLGLMPIPDPALGLEAGGQPHQPQGAPGAWGAPQVAPAPPPGVAAQPSQV
jgi:hypothetical protein